MIEISTSNTKVGLAFPNQKKIDRTNNGVLWMLESFAASADATPGEFYLRRSSDGGDTWYVSTMFNTGGTSYQVHGSLFIDEDDYAHIIYKDGSDGYLYYRRGTPDTNRENWTWSADVVVTSGDTRGMYPDIVAFREGSGWVAYCVYEYYYNPQTFIKGLPITISSTGTITVGTIVDVAVYSGNIRLLPSLDFHHTVNGKSIKDGTPHLYLGWTMATTGTGNGIRFKRAAYSAGTWTWGTEREIDSTMYVDYNSWQGYRSLSLRFNGSDIFIGGTGQGDVGFLYKRDAADTTTTTLRKTATNAVFPGSIGYDDSGKIYYIGREGGSSPFKIRVNVISATDGTLLNSFTKSYTTQGMPYLSVRAGYSYRRIDYVFTSNVAVPYALKWDSVDLNSAPTATGAQAFGVARPGIRPITVIWGYSDAESDPQVKYKIRWRKKIV